MVTLWSLQFYPLSLDVSMYSSLATLALLATGASSQAIKGFNYGGTFTDGRIKAQPDFQNEFNQAKGLVGAPGFTSARLYTMIQGT